MRRRVRRKAGFYRGALAAQERAEGDGVAVDVGEIKQRLLREMRRRPGNLQFLLQSSKTLLRAEAMERRTSAGAKRRLGERVAELMEGLGEQLLPGAAHNELPPAERINELT